MDAADGSSPSTWEYNMSEFFEDYTTSLFKWVLLTTTVTLLPWLFTQFGFL